MIRRHFGIILVLALTLLLYFPSLFYDFVGDDSGALIRLNLLFHLGNIILIYIIGRFIFKSSFLGVLAALIFAVHPIVAEVVCWVSVFGDAVLTFFALATIILFAKFYLSREKALSRSYFIASYVSYILALGSKEPAVGIPVLLVSVCLFLDWGKFALPGPRKKIWSTVIFFAAVPVYLLLRKIVIPESQIGLFQAFHNTHATIYKIAYYLRDLIFPLDFGLLRSFMYDHGLVSAAITIALIAVGLFVVIFLARCSSQPIAMISFFWVVFTLTMPVLAPFVPMRRHLYFPLVGFAVLLAAMVFLAKKKLRLVFLIALYVIFAVWTSAGRIHLFKISSDVVAKGLVSLQKNLPQVEPGSVICLAGIPGVLKNTPSFWPAPADKIKLLYKNIDLDIFCASVITFTEKSIKESHFEFVDNYTFVQSLESNLDESIRVPGVSSSQDDNQWKMNPEEKGEFKVMGRNKFGEVEIMAFRIFPEVLKGKNVYIVSYKDGELRVIKQYRVN